jgi:cytoskeletal protein CcmA (bactofilin family)
MATTAEIGKTIQVKGTVTADEPLTVAGKVEGSITVSGHTLTITAEGVIQADATADTILIDGSANGCLTAVTRMTLRDTSTVSGEIHAPTLSVAEGAKIQGRIVAGGKKPPAQVVQAPVAKTA